MINHILIISLVTIGVFIASEEGMIFYGIKKRLLYLSNGRVWVKPIIACVYCMPSVYGFIYFVYLGCKMGFSISLLPEWVLSAAGSVALNTILWNIIRILRLYSGFLDDSLCECPKK